MELNLGDFKAQAATHIVSLGIACDTAYNLRRYFDFGGAFPLDWWIVPPSALTRFLRNPDAEVLYDLDKLALTSNGGGVYHTELDLHLLHEFPRVSMPSGPISADWREHVDGPKARTTALLQKLLALNAPGNRVAFIRHKAAEQDVHAELENLFYLADWIFIQLDDLGLGPIKGIHIGRAA